MNREIIRLAIPNIISNITVPLLGLVDMYIVGHLDSSDYIAAITLATMVFNFIYWSFAFLRMGTSGFSAQAFGSGDIQESSNIFLRSLFIAFCGGILIIISQPLIAHIGFSLLDGNSMAKSYAQHYFNIYIWSAPAVLAMYSITGWFVGMQNAKAPMLIAISINMINICLCFLFVYALGMKIEGVALASLCAQYSGLLLSLFIWWHKYGRLGEKINFKVLKDAKTYLPFFKVNRDIYIRTMALIAVTTFFVSASGKLGEDILSVNALIMQTFLFFSFFMDGFAYAAEALTGRFIGAGNLNKVKQLTKLLFIWGIGIAILFTSIYALFIDNIISFLTDKQEVISASYTYQHWAMMIPIASFTAFLWDGIFIGALASRQMRNSMLISCIVFFVVYFFGVESYGNNIMWIAFLSYLFIRGVMQTALWPSVFKTLANKKLP